MLSRYLELDPSTLVLREPDLLTQIARDDVDCRPDCDELRRLTLRLLERRFEGDRLVVVKANDLCTRLAELALRRNPLATASVVAIPLRVFVAQVLRTRARRAWIQHRVGLARRLTRGWVAADTPLSDGRAAAYWWSFNEALFDHLCRRHPDRVVRIDGEDVANRPQLALHAIASVCGSAAGAAIDLDDVAGQHAKTPARRYDAESRGRTLRSVTAFFQDEVDDAMSWTADRPLPVLSAAASAPA